MYLKSVKVRNYQILEDGACINFYSKIEITITVVITDTEAESMFYALILS